MVRKPDASYIAFPRMTAEEYDADGFIEIVPDLVAEVVSPNDQAEEARDKIENWLAAGVRLVWQVYPSTRVVQAYRPDGRITLYRVGDTLTADDVLPGFACPVAELFRVPAAKSPHG